MTAALTPLLEWVMQRRGRPLPDALRALSDRLPAIACAGLELRLDAEGDGVVDVQQGLRTSEDVERLRRWLDEPAVGAPDLPGPWAALRSALNDGLLDLPFRDFWLEIDGGTSAWWPPLSVFVRFAPDAGAATLEQHFLPWLARLGRPVDAALRQGLGRCLEACGPGQRVSHLGWMLGRSDAPLRLVVEGVAWDDGIGFLQRAGWPLGDRVALQAVLDDLFVHFDRIRFALDLGDDGQLTSALGLECFLGRSERHDWRWPRVLEALCAQGLCRTAACAPLASWPGMLTPADAGASWPDGLIVDAIAREANEPGWLDLRISHVKFHVDGARAVRPKAYIGFMETVASPVPAPSAAPVRAAGRDVRTSALDFLLAARTPAGLWQDYPGWTAAMSDEWLSAYVGHAVAVDGTERGRRAAERAWQLLARRGRDGWGWSQVQPADADSTVWALRLAAELGHAPGDRTRRALAFLRRHVSAEGGVATYLADHYLEWMGDLDASPGWFEVHPCVTAAAACLDELAPVVTAHLRRSQHADGHWSAYWWADEAYTAALAVEALARSSTPADLQALARARDWAHGRLEHALSADTGASACTIAWLSLALRYAGAPASSLLVRAEHRLQECQRADGSWDASAILHMPNTRGGITVAVDDARVMTTAAVLRALGSYPSA